MKKGAISVNVIIGVVILLISVAAILLLFKQLDWKDQIRKEACSNSVTIRAGLTEAFSIGEAIDLKCSTNKICVRANKLLEKGKCEEQFHNTKQISYKNIKTETDIEKLISDEIIDCWSLMGEGKISLFSEGNAKYGIGTVYPTCVICSRIAFDKKTLQEKNIDPNNIDLVEYMQAHKAPSKNISYYEYLAGDSPAKISVPEKITIPKINKNGTISQEESTTLNTSNLTTEEYLISDELAIVFMQISAPTKTESFLNIGKTIFGTGIAVSVIGGVGGTVAMGKMATAACGGPLRGAICGGLTAIALSAAAIKTENNRGITALKCGDISVGERKRNGCSVIRTVNYDPEEIKQYCAKIESIT